MSVKYLTTNRRLTKRGDQVTIHSQPHSNVWLVINPRGEIHSVTPGELQEEPVVDEIIEEIKTQLSLF